MVKTSTIETVISKHKVAGKAHRASATMPSDESVQFLLSYSRALQVFGNNITGQAYVILN
ncbi:MAG TPA: hypothetical protein PLJ84_03620 [Bacteroidales bacterium]|nr:hypothetical protein [Bacteroidales bacterium]HPT01661.1 hypothetical protein [Bacteroidales bacterium]